MLAIFQFGEVQASQPIKGPDGYYYLSPEDTEKIREWIETLPVYEPDITKGPPPSRLNWADYGYVGFPRMQAGCGNCGMFATVGMLEVQHALNCCELHRCPCDISLFPLHLSTEIVLECSRHGYNNGCAGGGPEDIKDFMVGVGTTYEEYEPFEHADFLVGFDEPFPNICPLLDREMPPFCTHDPLPSYRPSSFIYPLERNGKCDLLDYLELNPSLFTHSLTFYKVASNDDFYSVPAEKDRLVRTIADGHVVASGIAWRGGTLDSFSNRFTCKPGLHDIDHEVLIVGYEDNGDTLLIRNSHGEFHLWKVPFGDCNLGLENWIIDNTFSYEGCPEGWLNDDADDDGIPNITDMCLYTWNKYRLSPNPNLDLLLDADCDGWWENDPTISFIGCDTCYDYERGIGIKESDRWDEDNDGIGYRCDACPTKDIEDTRYICYDCPPLKANSVDKPSIPPLTTCPADRDNDGICDHCDYCPDDKNLLQGDIDRDKIYDACDGCPINGEPDGAIFCSAGSGFCDCYNDEDHDYICDDPACDNCPGETNIDQFDADWDGIGNICDGCPFRGKEYGGNIYLAQGVPILQSAVIQNLLLIYAGVRTRMEIGIAMFHYAIIVPGNGTSMTLPTPQLLIRGSIVRHGDFSQISMKMDMGISVICVHGNLSFISEMTQMVI